MSKAFTRESDNETEPLAARPLPPLPPGVKNYLTADGAGRMRAELARLAGEDRPAAAAIPDPAEARRRVRVLDERIAYLHQILQSAVVVQPPIGEDNQVRFGATAKVRDSAGIEAEYRIVGFGETDLDRGWVSSRSPIALALMNARVGDKVRFRTPAGQEELEIVDVHYEPANS